MHLLTRPQLPRTTSHCLPQSPTLTIHKDGVGGGIPHGSQRANALATRSIPLTRAASLPILRSQQQRRQLHLTPRNRAPNNSLLGINSSSNVPSSYFQRPSLPANTIIRFVPQQTAWIVERMGKFNRILQPGLAILWPFLDRIAYVKSLKEAAIEIPSQSAITADNVTLELDGKASFPPSTTRSKN
jgi:SPFH domain / Band 7 family